MSTKVSQQERVAPQMEELRMRLGERLVAEPDSAGFVKTWDKVRASVSAERVKADGLAAAGDRAMAKSLRLRASSTERGLLFIGSWVLDGGVTE